jgi:hypothetical protein
MREVQGNRAGVHRRDGRLDSPTIAGASSAFGLFFHRLFATNTLPQPSHRIAAETSA